MSDISLTKAEADALIAMEKHKANDDTWDYPQMGGSICIPLISADKRESFLLDISRGRIDLLRGKYQNRARQAILLVRLDFGGPGHRNPDDQVIPCPHLHLYREGWGLKWAVPVPTEHFPNTRDLWQTLHDFMKYCNITIPPIIDRGLFV